MRFDIITLFPEIFETITKNGVTSRALNKGLWSLNTCNPREFTSDIHNTVDDRPYGGGPGMVMMAQPLHDAVCKIKQQRQAENLDDCAVILMSPTGIKFNQTVATELADSNGAIIVCGRYEGIDQRFIDKHVTKEISIGDFVLSGGEIAALAIIDSAVRLLPGALGHNQSAVQDSFSSGLDGLLDSPHYTRPEIWQDMPVPSVLLSGNHAHINEWRKQQSLELTKKRRPDLLGKLNKNK